MEHQIAVAAPALTMPAAAPTHEHWRKTAAVEKQQALFPGRQTLANGGYELLAEPFDTTLAAEIDNGDLRRFRTSGPCWQAHFPITIT